MYFLNDKSQIFEMFKIFKASVKKETCARIICLRTYRRGEYNSNEFAGFCRNEGVKRQLTTSYTPQQNGVAKRKNQTIEHAR